MTEQLCLFGGDGEARDVVQTRLKRENRPRQLARLSGIGQKVQRNRLIEGEGTGDKQASAAALAEVRQLSEKDIATLIAETKQQQKK